MKSLTLIEVTILSVLYLCSTVQCFNVLYISLMPSPSHHIWDKTLAMALREKQHQVTFVTHSPEKSIENFTCIVFEGVYEKLYSSYDINDITNLSPLQEIIEAFKWMFLLTKWDFQTEGFHQLMDLAKKNTKFDVILFDMTTAQFMYPIIEKFGSPPVVATSQFGVPPYYIFHFGLEVQPAFNPLYMLPYTDEMTFIERVKNYFYTAVFIIYRQYIYMPAVWKKSQEYFGKDIIPYQDVERNVSILLANVDHVMDYPRSLPPAIIPVGGLQTKRPQELQKDLKKILDESKDGVVLFSLGSNYPSSFLKEDQKQELIKGLGRLKQTIIWKYETEITGLPKNFITRKWLPQNDILAHPNVRVFITHGGALSTQEAMFHGVPVVGMPFYADQISNTHRMASRKLGRTLKCGELTSDIVYETLSDVLNNPEYKENAKQLSKKYRDQPEDALTRAVWWVEYTVRHGGAQHLRIASRDLPYYTLHFLDMWAAILVTTLGIVLVVFMCKRRSNRNKQEVDAKKKIK